MRTVCIIQARRGSKRLRDKILKPLSGASVLEQVIRRVSAIEVVDEVVCATVDDEYNKPVLQLAEAAGAAVFAGSEHDVLGRYFHAAVEQKAEAIMRVTADCPLLDPSVCAEVVQKIQSRAVDYSATAGSWPHGMDCINAPKENHE